MRYLPSRAASFVKAKRLTDLSIDVGRIQAAGRCRTSHPHMHCARGAVIRQEIGDEQA